MTQNGLNIKEHLIMIYFIGAGPGPVELITVKGKALLEQADLIIYPEPPIKKLTTIFSII